MFTCDLALTLGYISQHIVLFRGFRVIINDITVTVQVPSVRRKGNHSPLSIRSFFYRIYIITSSFVASFEIYIFTIAPSLPKFQVNSTLQVNKKKIYNSNVLIVSFYLMFSLLSRSEAKFFILLCLGMGQDTQASINMKLRVQISWILCQKMAQVTKQRKTTLP